MAATDTQIDFSDGIADVPMDLDELAAQVEAALEELVYKFAGDGRIRDEEREKVRLRMAHEIGYLAGRYREIFNDIEDRNTDARLARLEEELDLARE